MPSQRLIQAPPREATREERTPEHRAPRHRDPGRVGVLQVVLSLGVGGTERLVVELCRRLHPIFSMTVCALDEPGLWANELRGHGIDVVALRRRPGFRPLLGHRLAQVAKSYRASIIHCHHYSPFVYGSIARLLRPGLRMIFTEHGRLSDSPPSPKRRLINPLVARIPHALFAVSDALRHSLIDEGFPARRVRVIHNGIDPASPPSPFERRGVRQKLGLSSNSLVVGTTARLDPVKDLGTLIEAFAIVRQHRPDAILAIVGDGDERRHLEEIARRFGLLRHVRFLGQRPDARQLLAAFDIYVNSSISEGVSLTILEAMAAELPVVATAVGGTPEVVIDGMTGLLVEPRRPHAIAEAVCELAIDAERRHVLGLYGRTIMVQRFSMERMVDDYSRVYESLVR